MVSLRSVPEKFKGLPDQPRRQSPGQARKSNTPTGCYSRRHCSGDSTPGLPDGWVDSLTPLQVRWLVQHGPLTQVEPLAQQLPLQTDASGKQGPPFVVAPPTATVHAG